MPCGYITYWNVVIKEWCERGELNPYGLTHWLLRAKEPFFTNLHKPVILQFNSLISGALFFLLCQMESVRSRLV
jgi:hypothetical protein